MVLCSTCNRNTNPSNSTRVDRGFSSRNSLVKCSACGQNISINSNAFIGIKPFHLICSSQNNLL